MPCTLILQEAYSRGETPTPTLPCFPSRRETSIPADDISELFRFFDILFLLHYTNETKPTTTSSTDTMAAGIEDVTCYLLQLPGELRNRIYRLVLTDGMPIINFDATGYVRPGLISTCKEIRQEALSIYYYENSFRTWLKDYDAANLTRFSSSLKVMELAGLRVNVTFCYSQNTVPKWANLLEWLRCSHAKDVAAIPYFPEALHGAGRNDQHAYALGTLFLVTSALHKQPWEEVRAILISLRPTLGSVDERWML